MKEFRFVMNGKEYKFEAEYNYKSIRQNISNQYPNAEFDSEECYCYDACSCENGCFVSMVVFEPTNNDKPWVGEKTRYTSRLQSWENFCKTIGTGKNKKKEHYQAWSNVYLD